MPQDTTPQDDRTSTASQHAVEASRRSAGAVGDIGARFMLDMDMYGEVAGVGYSGLAFYFAGRGGVLGDVDHTVVHETFTFFPTETVREAWESAETVEDRASSARRFASYAASWATTHLPADGVEYRRLAELAGKVIDAAEAEGAPLFAGWRDLDEPAGDRELAVHRMNALRELRGARHAAAIREADLPPVEAFFIRSPGMAAIFGWATPEEEPTEQARALWQRAEDLTDERFGADLAVLDDAELDEFCDLAAALQAAIT